MSNLYVYLFRSRNKDNKDIENYKSRTKIILEYDDNYDDVLNKFNRFVNEGVPGEKSRLYRSVNSRNEDKIRDEMLIRLIKNKPSMTKLNSILASVAQDKLCKDDSKWMFDFDCNDVVVLYNFIPDLMNVYGEDNHHEIHETPNGFAIVCDHGFDTRELLEKYKDIDITLKRDDMLFIDIKQK